MKYLGSRWPFKTFLAAGIITVAVWPEGARYAHTFRCNYADAGALPSLSTAAVVAVAQSLNETYRPNC